MMFLFERKMKTKQQTKTVSRQVFNTPLTVAVKVSNILSVIFLFLLIVHISGACNVKQGGKFAIIGPTAENALAAEQELTNALLANDPDAVGRLLDNDWAVISADGRLGDGIRTALHVKRWPFQNRGFASMEISPW
jgi:hypothetical protein